MKGVGSPTKNGAKYGVAHQSSVNQLVNWVV